jgi:hypothetical protein
MFLERGMPPKTGAEIPYTPIPVTPAERAAYRERNSANRITATGGGVSRRMPIEDALFPPEMPAFIASSVLADPGGRIWVGRSFRSTDKTRRYDLYDSRGAHAGTATLPVSSRVVGFGDGLVYVARTDPADDLVYLERHRLRQSVPNAPVPVRVRRSSG